MLKNLREPLEIGFYLWYNIIYPKNILNFRAENIRPEGGIFSLWGGRLKFFHYVIRRIPRQINL